MVPFGKKSSRILALLKFKELLAKETGRGEGEMPKYIGHCRQGLEVVSRDPRFDPKYGEGFGKTPNILTGYEI